MNLNYVKDVKSNLERFLSAGFITPIDQATKLLPIIVVPKKNAKLHICVNFFRFNTTTKKVPYLLPLPLRSWMQ